MLKYILIGYGQRGKFYADCLRKLGRANLVALCDTRQCKLDLAKKNYGLKDEQLFSDADALFAKGRIADLAIIASMDSAHYEQAVRAMRLGYHLLLEKPIAQTEQQCREIAALAKELERKVYVCHVLRYAPIYTSIKEMLASGAFGEVVTISQTEDQEGFLVMEVNESGPAQEAGLQVEDLLIRVAGTDVREMTMEEVRNLVRGEEGTFVTMTVLRQGEVMEFSVERRTVQTVVASAQMLDNNIGLVTIENFDSRCAEETIAAIETLLEAGAEMLIFDVRNNPGGYASELVKVLDYLLPEGEVFHTVTYDGKEDIDYSDEECLELPMAVLVNENSYSAAEFFAAAMSEYEAAVIVGEQTSGKGYFQYTYQLSDGSAVGLSVGKYYTPEGENLQDVGITPDIHVMVDEETLQQIYYGYLEPEEDPQIQAAVKALLEQK